MHSLLMSLRSMGVAVLLTLATLSSLGQSYISDIGAPTYSTTLPIDNGYIDLSNGNLHLEIQLSSPAQRGGILSAAQTLVYDSRIWQGSTGSWQPTNGATQGGWRFVSAAKGQISGNTSITQYCDVYPPKAAWRSTSYGYTDPSGVYHYFPFQTSQQYTARQQNPCYDSSQPDITTGDAIATDSSGYHLYVTNMSAAVYDRNGTEVYPVLEDHNGNYLSTDNSGNLIDTSGNTPVLVTTSGSTTYYDVLGQGGTRNRWTVATSSNAVNTYFGQSGVSEYSGTVTAIQTITLPGSNGSYQFSYDSYGELSSMTLPSGGTITFGYTNFTDAYSDVNRWVTSRIRDGGTWLYTPSVITPCSGSACSQRVVVTSPGPADDTVYTMTLNNGAWNSEVDQYSGSYTSGTMLQSTQTAYNFSNTCPTGAGSYCIGSDYITAANQTTTLIPVSLATTTTLSYDGPTTQNVSAVQVWDYYPVGSQPSLPTEELDYTYGYARTHAQPALTNVSTETYVSGSPVMIAKTTTGYDGSSLTPVSGVPNQVSLGSGRGNVTSVAQWVNTSSSYLTTNYQYDDAGSVRSVSDANGTTSYGYDSTDIYQTSVSLPTPSSGVSLSASAAYDPNAGMILSSTDVNSQTTQYKNYDALNRVQEIDLPNGGKTTYAYTPTQVSELHTLSSSSTSDRETQLDGYGRVSRVAIANGQGTNPWYQQDTCFDGRGRMSFVSSPYQGNGWSTSKVCSGSSQGTSYSYDSLDRIVSLTNADGTSYEAYNGRATKITDVNNVSRVIQSDWLGRTTSVCEVSGSSSNFFGSGTPSACGQDISATGLLTSYSYDLVNTKTTVTQGSQQRVFQSDSIGRPILTTEPERGTTTYSYAYNSTGLQVIQTSPQANQIAPSSATATRTTQYDSLGRVLTVSYSDGTPTKTFQYDSPTWAEASQQTNLKGRLSLRQLVSSAGTAGTLYSYDAAGNVSFTYNCLPSGCGNAALDIGVFYGYDFAGDLTSESDGSGVTYTYGRSPAGEVTAVTSSLSDGNDPANIVVPSSVQNSPFGPTSFSLGNGTNQVNAYDSLGRNINGWVCNNHSTAPQCGGSGMLYGYGANWKGAQITSSLDTVQGTSSTYGYDEFNRLSAMNLSNGQTYQYLYDRWGNRWQQNAPQGGTTTTLNFNAANQVTGTGNSPNSYVYDIAGNLHNDGVNTYSYDAEGNLTGVVSGGNTTTYIYDTANRRIRTQGSGSPVEVVFDENGKRLSTWSSGSLSKANIYWDGRAIGYRTGGATHFEHQDWLGTERMRTTASGSVEGSYSSLPFGDSYSASGTDTDQYHFAGLDNDAESGTQHAQFRQYSSMQGRWLSPDPSSASYDSSNPQSLNRYSYVLDAPLNYADPLGLDCTVLIGGITQTPGTASTSGQQSFANSIGAYSVYPYAGGGLPGGVAQVWAGATTASQAVSSALLRLKQAHVGPIDIITFSGGAQAFQTAMQQNPELASQINNVTYISPGTSDNGLWFTGQGTTTALLGTGLIDFLATINSNASLSNLGINFDKSGCPHDANCAFVKNRAFLLSKSSGPCQAKTSIASASGSLRLGITSGPPNMFSFFYTFPTFELVTTTISYPQAPPDQKGP